MKVEIKAPFLNLYSRINLFNTNKLTDMNDWEKQSVDQAKIKLYPTFHTKAPVVQVIDNLKYAQEAFSRMAKRAHNKMLESDRGQEILAKAAEYHIEYDKNNINWFMLIDSIKNYEVLLKQACELNLPWDYRFHDPIGLKQEIEEAILQERRCDREQRSDYLHTRM